MFVNTIRGEQVAQLSVRIGISTFEILEQIAKAGNYKSVNKLVESILFEIALDESNGTNRSLTSKKSQDLTKHGAQAHILHP